MLNNFNFLQSESYEIFVSHSDFQKALVYSHDTIKMAKTLLPMVFSPIKLKFCTASAGELHCNPIAGYETTSEDTKVKIPYAPLNEQGLQALIGKHYQNTIFLW